MSPIMPMCTFKGKFIFIIDQFKRSLINIPDLRDIQVIAHNEELTNRLFLIQTTNKHCLIIFN